MVVGVDEKFRSYLFSSIMAIKIGLMLAYANCVRQICFERSLFLGKLMLSKKILFSFLVQKVRNCLFNVYSTWADAYFSKNLSEFFELLDISWANIWFIWLSKWKAPNFDAHLCLNIAQKPQLSFRVFSSLFSDKK